MGKNEGVTGKSRRPANSSPDEAAATVSRGVTRAAGRLQCDLDRGQPRSADAAGLYGPALSNDIDFLGSARAALAFGAATGGKVAVAGWESAHSPNTALVTLDIDGESHLIDFLTSMKGFSAEELERVRSWAAPLRLGREAPRPMPVMHPAHCLEAQLRRELERAIEIYDRRHRSPAERPE